MTHEITEKTVSLVEQAIIESRDYETEAQLWKHLESKMSRADFDAAISQLLTAGKIMFNGPSIIYTGIDNANLRELVDSSVPF
ncbi:MAG TPA: hypothetical protein VGR56_08140 [Nitrososphaerales archaeon]|nr:hypothetical protein [Nitrososphaerales archaeon]